VSDDEGTVKCELMLRCQERSSQDQGRVRTVIACWWLLGELVVCAGLELGAANMRTFRRGLFVDDDADDDGSPAMGSWFASGDERPPSQVHGWVSVRAAMVGQVRCGWWWGWGAGRRCQMEGGGGSGTAYDMGRWRWMRSRVASRGDGVKTS
jgi:hypothetical protein